MSDKTKTIEDYKNSVQKLAELKSSHVFQNSNLNHAAIVIATMLEHSFKEFIIYDDNLSGDIADKNEQVYANLGKFIERGGRLRVVVDSVQDKSNRVYKLLEEMHGLYPTRVDLKYASKEFVEAVKNLRINNQSDREINFACGDETSFRLETLRGKREAYCSFNKPEVAKVLGNVFNKYIENCDSVLN